MGNTWVREELGGSVFKDKRLDERFLNICEKMALSIGSTIPDVCEDWAQAKATYRFLSNDRISEAEIFKGHFESTKKRVDACEGPILVLHDTTEFSYTRKGQHDLGVKHRVKLKGRAGIVEYIVRGILMHASLAATPEGLPLGLTSVKFWTRDKFKGANALRKKINPTRVPIEEKESIRWLQNLHDSDFLIADPSKCIHIGDRENDIYEFFCNAQELDTKFLVRASVNRLAEESTIADIIGQEEPVFTRQISFTDKHNKEIVTNVSVKYKQMEIHPPIGKEAHYPSLNVVFINVHEIDDPVDREAINWNLVSNMLTTSDRKIWEMVGWYKQRWTIEIFFKILKTICKAEDSKLRASERLARYIAILCIMSWRIHWMTMMAREEGPSGVKATFSKLEVSILDAVIPERKTKKKESSAQFYLTKVAKLGGYLARASDPPPGPLVIWRGLMKLNDFQRVVTSGFETS